MYCLDDMRDDILSYVKKTLTIESCWQLCNACLESTGDIEETLFNTCMDWIVDNIDNSSLSNFPIAKLEVAKKFFQRCLDHTAVNAFPLSYWELHVLGEKYEEKNSQYQTMLTGLLHVTGRLAVPAHLMNGTPFKISIEDISKEEKCRHFNYQNSPLKAYWEKNEKAFRVFFDYDQYVWDISVSLDSEDNSPSQDISLKMGTCPLSVPRSWIYYIRRGLCVTIMNQTPKRNITIDSWFKTCTCLNRGEHMMIILSQATGFPSFPNLISPHKKYVLEDERGIYIRLRVDFPISTRVPEDQWWLK
jgi:hypothetical protein